MIGYLYQITNTLNGKKYIGKTNDMKRRIGRHYADLQANRHHSHKLQRSYNKYGKENFKVTYEIFDNITEEELSLKQQEYIQKYDSFYNGYNETFGGEGKSTAIDFNTSILIYQIGQRYDGIRHLLSKYFNCDRTVISGIINRQSLSIVQYDQNKLKELIQKTGITEKYLKENYKNNYDKLLTEEQVLTILSAIELKNYTQAACGKVYGVTKDIIQKICSGKTYKQEMNKFKKLSLEQKQKLANKIEKETDIINIGTRKISKIKIDQNIVDYIMDHKDKKTQVQIANQLNIDRKRVGRIIKKQTYANLVQNWQKRHN